MTTETSEAIPDKPKKSPLRYVTIVVRTLMGLLFIMTGLNGFLNFLPPPPPNSLPEGALNLIGAFKNSGYMLHLISGTQLLGGILLVTNSFVPLALAILAPVIFNIIAFHAFLSPSGIGMAAFVVVAEIYLAWAYRSSFRAMLVFHARHTC
jgi:uncharacterized membrane protein YphA (DoxX/SURF4 family)